MNYISLDKKVIEEIVNKLPANSETITEIQKSLPFLFNTKYHNCSTKQIDLGYGLKLICHTFYGGYTTYYWKAISFKNYILTARTAVSPQNSLVAKHLLKDIKIPVECNNGDWVSDQIFQNNISKYVLDSSLLFIDTIKINNRKNEALLFFTDIFSDYDYEPFHVNYSIPAAFDQLRYFIANNDIESLENILFSPNSAGRLFAASTLIYMKKNSPYIPTNKITKRIEEVLQGPHKISMGIISCYTGKFDYDYFDVVENFDSSLINN